MAGKHGSDWDDSALLAHLEEADSGKGSEPSTAVELRLAALEREVAALKAEVASLKSSGGRIPSAAGGAQPAAKQPRIDSSSTHLPPSTTTPTTAAHGPSSSTSSSTGGPVQEVVLSLNKRAAISTYKNASFVDLRETYVDQTGEVSLR